MYNKFSIEAVIGKDKETKDDILAIEIDFFGKKLMLPIVQCKDQGSYFNSIREHIAIANSIIQKQIARQIKDEELKIVTN